MQINIITLFPEMFEQVFSSSILGRGIKTGAWNFRLINLRDFGEGNRKNVDDDICGGGVGRLLRADILDKAVHDSLRGLGIDFFDENNCIFFMSPRGIRIEQNFIKKSSRKKSITIICGRYEGIDSRIIKKYNITEISIGDFVLTGGEIPAMAFVDAVVRLIPGVIQNNEFDNEETFSEYLIEYDQFTKPVNFDGMVVPEQMLSGNHAEINMYRRIQSINMTREKRPDLWAKFVASQFNKKD